MKIIVPGSYDPVTLGHLDIIRRAAERYDEVYAVIFRNPDKTYRYSLDDRMRMLMLATDGLDNVLVSESDGLVIDYMREHGIDKIVKGYRNDADLAYEKIQEDFNFSQGGYQTEYLKADARFAGISSTLVREKTDKGESLEGLLPDAVIRYIENH